MANSATRPPIKFITHNVQGLNSPVKHYKSLQADVLFLQKTHFTPNYNPSFLHHNYPHFYLANGPGKTGGLAICFSKRVSLSLEKGCYLVLVRHLEGTLVNLIAYYAPNSVQ